MKKLTREERRRRSQRRLQLITYLLFLLLLLAWLGSYLIMTVEADRPAMHKPNRQPSAKQKSPQRMAAFPVMIPRLPLAVI